MIARKVFSDVLHIVPSYFLLVWPLGIVGLQIVLRDQKSKEGFKSQSIEIYWSEQRAGLSLRQESYKEATQKYSITDYL